MGMLTALHLKRNDIGAAAALFAAIASLPNLNVLDLSHNSLRATGARALSRVAPKLGCLYNLDVSHNDIQDEGLEALSTALVHLPCLESFVAATNGITDAGATSLAAVLPRCRELTSVGLAGNLVSEDGQCALALARVSCRIGASRESGGAGRLLPRLVNIDVRRFRGFHPLGGLSEIPTAGPGWCFLCYTSDACRCPVFVQTRREMDDAEEVAEGVAEGGDGA